VIANILHAKSAPYLYGILFIVSKKTFIMDDPNKKKADGKRVSQQPHEQAYQRKKKAAKKTSGKGKK
jgi:hypothetical protein